MTKRLLLGLAFAGGAVLGSAQDDPCTAWTSLPQQDANAAEEAHVIYRDQVKAGNFDAAFANWEKVYKLAPAADGKRPFHYSDGRAIYLDKFAKATDPAGKDEAAEMVAKLYDEERQCYQNEAMLYGLQVYDMFYTMQRPYTETYPVALQAMEVGGDSTDFRVITPVGYLVTYMYTNEQIDAAEARKVIEQARGIVAANAEGPNAADYTAAQEGMDAAVSTIERFVFDCAYFKQKLEPEYRADADNPAVYQAVYAQLLQAGCEKEDPLLAEIAVKDRAFQDSVYQENNPIAAGQKLYEEGDVDAALAKWEEAAGASEPEVQGAIYLKMSGVYRKDKSSLSQARTYAKKAAAARPGWGRPYIAIGDLYASSSRNCSEDPLRQRVVVLAALDQYARAKSDEESAADAQERINRYSSSIPTRAMLFEQGFKEGQTMNTGCWVGETVKLRTAG